MRRDGGSVRVSLHRVSEVSAEFGLHAGFATVDIYVGQGGDERLELTLFTQDHAKAKGLAAAINGVKWAPEDGGDD